MNKGSGGLGLMVFIENAEGIVKSEIKKKKKKDFLRTAMALLMLQGIWSRAHHSSFQTLSFSSIARCLEQRIMGRSDPDNQTGRGTREGQRNREEGSGDWLY